MKAEFKSNGLLEFCSVLVTWKAKGAVQTLQSVFYFSFTFHEFLVSLHLAARISSGRTGPSFGLIIHLIVV